MRRTLTIASILAFPLVLAACGQATNSNTNSVVLDLVNETVNVNVAVQANGNSTGSTNTNAPANANAAGNTNGVPAANTSPAATTVSLTLSGYSPKTITVKVGQTVTWTNSSGREAQVASDPHPTHSDLPSLFSPTLGDGQNYSFTFTQKGSWGYHDHLDPTTKGTVIVE